ncbi:MAG: single-stranded DNA-binding protein [Candidatus Pacebacteria bacterium]|nr:single-stranded DNA-binding protein [Candidatus Paceibacterota bacterium]
MARYINKSTIIGDLVSEPKLKEVRNGGIMITFVVITKREWRGQNGERSSSSEYHHVVLFGEFANTCMNVLKRGSRIYAEGPVETITWIDDDGVEGHKKQIRARNIIFFGKGETKEEEFIDNTF